MIYTEKQDILSVYLSQINKIPPISDKEFAYLYALVQNGNKKAKQRIVEGNLKLSVKVASKYKNLGLSMMDLIEEGNLGLIKSVDKFIDEKGAKFSTYAIWWIKQKVRRALDNQSGVIRIPSYAIQNIRKCLKYWDEISRDQEFCNKDIEKVAKDLHLNVKEVKNVLYSLEISKGATSLDTPIIEDENMTINDMVADSAEKDDPFLLLQRETNLNFLKKAMKVLSEKEKKIISQRFGLDGENIRTLHDIGEEWGVSRERIRQIAETAIGKLRDNFQELDRRKLPRC
ncbi:MAG: sigma-70 family RNA polymerase sigma factor [bacterium]|nr:sigma-70 family RNA polymerase sigma factor [bacterium]